MCDPVLIVPTLSQMIMVTLTNEAVALLLLLTKENHKEALSLLDDYVTLHDHAARVTFFSDYLTTCKDKIDHTAEEKSVAIIARRNYFIGMNLLDRWLSWQTNNSFARWCTLSAREKAIVCSWYRNQMDITALIQMYNGNFTNEMKPLR